MLETRFTRFDLATRVRAARERARAERRRSDRVTPAPSMLQDGCRHSAPLVNGVCGMCVMESRTGRAWPTVQDIMEGALR